ncbi:MAG: hypothetical protein CL878_14960 [Dehalococcoidia bacterium]|nr:hypothetical protein [Dehalococcoidia bacterium]
MRQTEPFWSALAGSDGLRERCYATILIGNSYQDGVLVPIAWQLARNLSLLLSLKDEKIGCMPSVESQHTSSFETDGGVYYALNFRREGRHWREKSPSTWSWPEQARCVGIPGRRLRSWFVPKPPPRERDVLLHPAKYPETLVAEFVERFTQPGETVLDPMAGTGSTLVACMQTGRRGIGIELSPDYAAIAGKRLATAETGRDRSHLRPSAEQDQVIIEGDALRLAEIDGLPAQVDYCITSPPYWDMLNMRGAMTQRARRRRGLHVSYGDNPHDLGNVADYEEFVGSLVRVYRQVAALLRSGACLTIIVKNVKKQGTIYPLAWDLAAALAEFLIVCPERFWCQDDVKLAPYGYGNAWVSNTVHHYCLTFQKT